MLPMTTLHSHKGFTLLEVILVIAVGSTIFLMGFNAYKLYVFNTNVAYIQQNVENLFNAAALFYKANCGSTLNTTTTPYLVDINSKLVTPLYLASNWEAQPYNPLVDYTDATGGYLVQVNLLPTSGNLMNVVCSSGDCSNTTTPGQTYPQALSSTLRPLLWEIQVSVKVSSQLSQAELSYIQGTTGGACLANLASGTTMNDCRSPGSAPFQWVVWTHLPSLATPNSTSRYWVTMPLLKQFNLQYTHDQMYELGSGTYVDNGNGNAQGYYTCGD